jgi:hypothetical protein
MIPEFQESIVHPDKRYSSRPPINEVRISIFRFFITNLDYLKDEVRYFFQEGGTVKQCIVLIPEKNPFSPFHFELALTKKKKYLPLC